MSIHDRLNELETRKNIHRYPPPQGFKARRALFVTDELLKELNSANSSVNFHNAKIETLRMFERWVKGDLIKVRLVGHKPGAFVSLLDPPPPDIWEFRITEPAIQFRVFFRFVSEDMIVATSIRSRKLLGNKKTKGGRKAQAWQDVMRECEGRWSQLFPHHEPMTGTTAADFLTDFENV